MKSYSFTPQGVCAKRITFAIGDDPKDTAALLQGNDCGGRGTSCADQLAIALNGALGKQ